MHYIIQISMIYEVFVYAFYSPSWFQNENSLNCFHNDQCINQSVSTTKAGGINTATVLVANNGEPIKIMCICCAELELELQKTQIELRSTQKIVELLWEEMSSATLQVRNSTIGGDRKDSGSDCPLDGYTWLQKQRKWHSDITVEAKVKFKVNNISYSRKDQDTDRQNDQLLNLSSSSSSTNTDFFPLLKSIKAAPKLDCEQ
jgi:hypothetical protein